MKKLFLAVLLVAATTAVGAVDGYFPVSINGKRFANAVTINGNLFVSVEDFSKAIGDGGTVRVQGNRLAIVSPRLEASNTADTFTKVGYGSGGGEGHAAATGGAGAGKVTFNPFTIKKSSDIASPIFMNNGKAFVSLADVARLFGGNLNVNVGTLRPGQAINLTVAPSPGASIAVH